MGKIPALVARMILYGEPILEKFRERTPGRRELTEDVEWIRKEYNFPGVSDKTEDYNIILKDISAGEHQLSKDIFYLFVPGLSYHLAPDYFKHIYEYFKNTLELDCAIAKLGGQAGVDTNATKLKDIVEEKFQTTHKPVLFLGHSKGGLDADAALRDYWNDLKDKVVGVIFAQSPYGGSPVASYLLRHRTSKAAKATLKLVEFSLKGDISCVKDLTYESRREFLSARSNPGSNMPDVATLSFSTIAPIKLTKMTKFAEVPLIKFPFFAPMVSVMGMFATVIDEKYSKESDGLVVRDDAEVPGSIVVRPSMEMDHAGMALAPLIRRTKDPDAREIWEALCALLLRDPRVPTFHIGVQCDICGIKPIAAPRFKSIVKHDYNLCQNCFDKYGSSEEYTLVDRPLSGPQDRPSVSENSVCVPYLYFRCDVCRVLPILGPRFNSNVEDNYDLCQNCFRKGGNPAKYTRIDPPV